MRHPYQDHRQSHQILLQTVVALAALSMSFAMTGPANAQQIGDFAVEISGVRSMAGGVFGAVPDYMGADETTVGFAPAMLWRYGNGERYLKISMTEVSWNAVDSRKWGVGPVSNYRLGRDDVDDVVVDTMRKIDGAVELGAFIDHTIIGDDRRDKIEFSLRFLVDASDTHEGYTTNFGVKRFWPVSSELTLVFGANLTYGSEDYMNTYFGVDADNALRSGLVEFAADGGARDVRVPLMGIYSFSHKWHMAWGLTYSVLVSDAADSPIVDVRGSKHQVSIGIGFAYAW